MTKERIIQILKKIISCPIGTDIAFERYNDFAVSHKDLYNKLLEVAETQGILESKFFSPISLDYVPAETECYDFVIGHMITLLAVLED